MVKYCCGTEEFNPPKSWYKAAFKTGLKYLYIKIVQLTLFIWNIEWQCSFDLVKHILLLNYLNHDLFLISDTVFWFTSSFFIQIWTRCSVVGRLKKYETSSYLGPCFSANTSTETPRRPLWNLTVQWCFWNRHNKIA